MNTRRVWLVIVALTARASATPPVLRVPADQSGKMIDIAVTTPVLEVLDPAGSVDRAAVTDALGKLALAACARETGWSGDAFAWIVVDWQGNVVRLEVAVDRPAVETCLTAELKKLVVSKAQGRATIFARLHAGAALLSTTKPDPPQPAPLKRGEVRATRVAAGKKFADADRVRDAVAAQLQDVTICYEQALEKKPRLGGTAAIELTVASTGAIDSASVGSAPGDMAACVKGAMLRMRLPAPSAPDKVQLTLQLGPAR